MKLKNTIIILVFSFNIVFLFAQARVLTDDELNQSGASKLAFGATEMTASEIDNYVSSISRLKKENKLDSILYPNMTVWGSLIGYYFNEELVLIETQYNAELGFSSQAFYLKQASVLKIVLHEHFAEWKKHEDTKMTYSDTVYSITFTNPIMSEKLVNNISTQIETNSTLNKNLIKDVEMMIKILNENQKQKSP